MLCWAFARVYRRWLWDGWLGTHDRVLRVRGWRSALVASVTREGRECSRRHMAACFWMFR